MGIDKSVFKMTVAHDIGVRLDDLLEGAKKENGASEGAVSALKLAAQKLEEFQRTVDKDRDEEKISQEDANIVKRYVNQCGGIVRNLVVSAEVRLLQSQGQVAAFKKSVGEIQRYYEDEKRKKEALEQALAESSEFDSGDKDEDEDRVRAVMPARPVGLRPGESLASQRKAETPIKQSEVASADSSGEKAKKKKRKKKED